jgi:hypothetical protein
LLLDPHHRLAAGQLERRVGPDGRVEIRVPRTTADVAVQTTIDLVERLNSAVALQAAPLLEALRQQSAQLARQGETIRRQADELGMLRKRLWQTEGRLAAAEQV